MFLSHFSQAYSEEDQRHWFHQTIMQTTGHFEYVYKDNYFSNSYEWKQTIVYFFHWYFIDIVLYLYDEKWKYYFRVWNIIFIFVCSIACYWTSMWGPGQMHFVADGLLFKAWSIFTLWRQHTHVKEAITDMHCSKLYCFSETQAVEGTQGMLL